MALKPCRECGQDVSTNALSCPHCGTLSPTPEALTGARQTAIGAGIVMVAVIAAWWVACGSLVF